jgi:two-component system, response regulator PdtaR
MPKTVLVVEDEYLVASELQLILEDNGFRVIGPAATVAAALKLLHGEVPSLAVLDVNIGNELVTPVAEKLKALDVPFVLATAYANPERFGGTALADAPSVGKPTSERRLLAALRKL